MTTDKLKQYIAMFGGFLGALYMLLQSYGIQAEYINPDKVNALVVALNSLVPFALVAYGIYKNTYLLTDKAKKQERVLKKAGLKPPNDDDDDAHKPKIEEV